MNKNAYFYPRKVNKNVNLVIFNMSKITFVALRRFIYPPGRWGSFWAIGYWIWAIGLDWIAALLLPLAFTPYTLHSTPAAPLLLSPLTSNLSTRLSSDEQRLPTPLQQQTATSPMLRQLGIGRIDHLVLCHPYHLSCGG